MVSPGLADVGPLFVSRRLLHSVSPPGGLKHRELSDGSTGSVPNEIRNWHASHVHLSVSGISSALTGRMAMNSVRHMERIRAIIVAKEIMGIYTVRSLIKLSPLLSKTTTIYVALQILQGCKKISEKPVHIGIKDSRITESPPFLNQ